MQTEAVFENGVFTDPRDGQKYKTVKLKDGKVWMAQNLNFDASAGCWQHEDILWEHENIGFPDYKKYGRLYTWKAALAACPPGWHLPSDEDWWEMTKCYGMAYNIWDGQQRNKADKAGKAAYEALIEGGISGFSALLAGSRLGNGYFSSIGNFGLFWSSTERSSIGAWNYYFRSTDKDLYRSVINKGWGYSCRCVQD